MLVGQTRVRSRTRSRTRVVNTNRMAGSGALVNKSESEKLTLNSLRRNDKTIEEVMRTQNKKWDWIWSTYFRE